jgi:glycosyltransferase involved in cell wall biosynthesis
MGMQRPHAEVVPEMAMAGRTRALSDELGLTGQHVFFNEGWVPYAERQNHLLDADLGVSTHFDHVETRYAFRTRILDYLWAGLPVIATEGDVQADLIAAEGWGRTVAPQDVAGLAAAIDELFDDTERAKVRSRVELGRQELTWGAAASRLFPIIDNALARPGRPTSLAQIVSASQLYRASAEVVHAQAGIPGLAQRIATRVSRSER